MEGICFKRYLMEFIGTFFLVFTVLSTGDPLAIGLVLAAAIYVGSNISGGHYNPAVTLALWIRGKFSPYQIPGYILFQTLGAFSASAFYTYLLNKTVYPKPMATLGTIEAILIETLGTFLFCTVILETTAKERALDRSSIGLIIGLTLTAVAFMGGTLSGGAFNPALGVGTIAFDCVKSGTSYNLLPIYLIGPFAGSILAGLYHRLMRPS